MANFAATPTGGPHRSSMQTPSDAARFRVIPDMTRPLNASVLV